MVDGVTGQKPGFVFSECFIVSQQRLRIGFVTVVNLYFIPGAGQRRFGAKFVGHVIPITGGGAELVAVSQIQIVVAGKFQTQTIHELSFQVSGGVTPVIKLISCRPCHALKDVRGILAFFVVGYETPFPGNAGIHAWDCAHQVSESVGDVHHSIVLALAEKTDAGIQPVVDLVFHVRAHVELLGTAIQAVMAHDTLIVQITH